MAKKLYYFSCISHKVASYPSTKTTFEAKKVEFSG